jgi:hypothetical protein
MSSNVFELGAKIREAVLLTTGENVVVLLEFGASVLVSLEAD